MQRSTLFAFLSVLCTSVLLVGPYSVVHSLWNFGEAVLKRDQADRLNTQAAARSRVELCEKTALLYQTLVRPAVGGGDQPGGAAPAFMDAEYKSATEEIRARIGQEEILFGLKLSLIGGIMAVLFTLFKKEERDFFEKLVQKRRAAAFFSAALLAAIIVDTRLRFNAKIIESLGNWIWCTERSVPFFKYFGAVIPWEGFLHFQLDRGANPLMRYSSHLLTGLLYGVVVYLFIVMPRTVNRSTRSMLTHSSAVFFLLLVCICVSYDCPYGGEWTLRGAVAAVLLGLAGFVLLDEAFRHRFITSNACRLTEGIVKNAERRAAKGRPDLKKRAHELRRTFQTASQLLEPAHLVVAIAKSSRDPSRVREKAKEFHIPAVTWRMVAELGRRWKRAHGEAGRLSRVTSSGKLSRTSLPSRIKVVARARCLWSSLSARYFEWKIARAIRPANVEAAHAAEERLWKIYLQDDDWAPDVTTAARSRRTRRTGREPGRTTTPRRAARRPASQAASGSGPGSS